MFLQKYGNFLEYNRVYVEQWAKKCRAFLQVLMAF